MGNRLTQASFTRGELSPRLDARTQLEQYDIGLKIAKNAIIHQEGGISNRMGLEFVGEVKYSDKITRLIKFVFSQEQTYILEFGHKYIRVLKDGGYILYPQDYGETEGQESVFDGYYKNINPLTLLMPDGSEKVLYTKNTTPEVGVEVYEDAAKVIYYGTISKLDKAEKEITITKDIIIRDEEKIAKRGQIVEIETPYDEKDIFNIKRSQSGDYLTLTHYDYAPMNLIRKSNYDWSLEDIIFKTSLEAPKNVKAVFSAATPTSNQRTYEYVVTAVIAEGNEESERSEVVSCTAHREANWLVGETITISCDEVQGASEYNFYRSTNGLFGYIGTASATEDGTQVLNNENISAKTNTKNPITNEDIIRITVNSSGKFIYCKIDDFKKDGKFYEDDTLKKYYGTCTYLVYGNSKKISIVTKGVKFIDDNIEPDLSSCAPVIRNPFEDNNPACSCYYQQRKVFANSFDSPQTLWASQTSTTNNFNVSRPLIATDAITLQMDDREMNEIRHLVPLKDLIVFTSNSEWRVNGTDGIFQATPTPAAVIQSSYGSSHIEPIISGSMIIFCQSGGSVIRDLGYDYMQEGYDGDELSIFSSHLFEGKEVVAMSYSKEPYRLVWVIFNDGSCACMTYNKKQKLCGWTRIETDGKFKSVDCVREGLEDVAYFVIEREINGQKKKYIERTKTRIVNNARTAFLVDCGLADTFDTPITTISGLEHLEGKEVIINADGGIITGKVVKDGKVTLDQKCTSIVVGLPYTFEIETLNIEGENTQGLKKVVNYVLVKIHQSREDFLFCGAEGSEFRHGRSLASINDSGKLFSTDVASTVLSRAITDATVKIKQDYPLPLSILSISAVVDVQDNENN